MQMVILAGGLATRLRPITTAIPKSMLEVSGRPFLEYQLELVRRHGVEDLVLCVGHLAEQIQDYFGDGSRFDVRIRYSRERGELLGTGGALKQAESLLAERFFVMYGDSYLIFDYRDVMSAAAGEEALMVVYRNSGRYDSSNVAVSGDRVVRYEKGGAGLDYIDAGLLVFRRSVLSTLPPAGVRAALDADLLSPLVRAGRVAAYVTGQRFYEIGSPAGLGEFQSLVESGALKLPQRL